MSQNTREIVTLQLGNYSNYVGAHWWNIQESGFDYDPNAKPSTINHDILFREGQNSKGNVTYTPRMLLVDSKSSLKHMSTTGELYCDDDDAETIDEQLPTNLWDASNVELIKDLPIGKPTFQQDLSAAGPSVLNKPNDYNLGETVSTWTDFLYSRYHPRSINVINNQSATTNSNEETLDSYTAGQDLWKSEYFQDTFSDRIRQYIEECNNCQGFQTIFDCTNGYAGLTLQCIEYLNDEYSKANLAVPVFAPIASRFPNANEAMSDSIRMMNIALAYSNLIEHSSMILPLSTMRRGWRQIGGGARQWSMFQYRDDNLYETSAVLASYLDTMTLSYRLKSSFGTNISGFCSDLTNYGRKLTTAALGLPFEMNSNELLIEKLDRQEADELLVALSPNSKLGTERIVQCVSVRGIDEKQLKRPLAIAKDQIKMAAYKCDTVKEMFELYFQCSLYASRTHVTACGSAMPTRLPYPIGNFDSRVGISGFLIDLNDTIPAPTEKRKCVPVIAAAQTCDNLADTIENLHREVSRIKIGKIHRFKETGFEDDEFEEMQNRLLQFKDNYDESFEL